MGTATNAPDRDWPRLTSEGLLAATHELEDSARPPLPSKFADAKIVTSKFVPEGFSVLMGSNSMAVLCPDGGVRAFTRRDMFDDWKPVK